MNDIETKIQDIQWYVEDTDQEIKNDFPNVRECLQIVRRKEPDKQWAPFLLKWCEETLNQLKQYESDLREISSREKMSGESENLTLIEEGILRQLLLPLIKEINDIISGKKTNNKRGRPPASVIQRSALTHKQAVFVYAALVKAGIFPDKTFPQLANDIYSLTGFSSDNSEKFLIQDEKEVLLSRDEKKQVVAVLKKALDLIEKSR
jgi:hypothetical protein